MTFSKRPKSIGAFLHWKGMAMNKGTLKRLEVLEAKRAKRDADPANLNMTGIFADLAILFVATPRKGEPVLTAYARGARYRGGVEELYRVATSDSDRFCDKHAEVVTYPSPHYRNWAAMPPIAPTREHVEGVRRKIVERLVVEELAHRVIDAAEAATGHRLIGHEPLSSVRPMRPAAVY
jgi:hypothetical protein